MEYKEFEQKLNDLAGLITKAQEKAAEEVKLHGTMLAETKTNLEKLQTQLDAIDLKIVEQHRNTPATQKSIADVMKESEDVQRLLHNKKGHAFMTLSGDQVADLMSTKTTILSGGSGFGSATAGVVPIERMPSIVMEARRRLRIRDLLSSRPTSSPLIYFVKVLAPLAIGSMQTEGSAKAENEVTFTTATTQVQTIATWIPASKQILDDFTELEGFLRSSMPYYVNRTEEQQFLSGDGTGTNLNGLITQASAFNVALLSAAAGYTRIDQIGAAIQQIELLDEIPPSFVALNPTDWWKMRRTKDGFGKYILGDPQSQGNPTIWDLATVPTNSMAAGTFLVGTGDSAAAEIRDRMEMQLEISTEHSDYFTRNLVAIRAEKRVALVVMRPQAFVTGTFATSPVGG